MTASTDHIEEYLNHQLSEKERTGFEEKLKNDQDFAGKVEEHALILNAFDEIKAKTLMAGFKSIENELKGGEARRLGFPVYLKWAATVAVLAVLSLVVYLNSGPTEQDLFLSYYAPYPNMESPTSRSEANGKAVWQLYENGDYAGAIVKFEQALAINEADFGSRFYLGISALELSRLAMAEEEFSIVAADKENSYSEQAEWYLALTYLKAGNTEKSINVLQDIVGSGSTCSGKAKDLMEELE